jgi:uncharacterized RDD family membrane protein YckC
VGITVLKNEVPWGPFNPGQIQDGLRRGDFTLLTPAHGPGMTDWQPLGEVIKQLEPPQVVLPPVPNGRILPPVPGYVPPAVVNKGPPPPPPVAPGVASNPKFEPPPVTAFVPPVIKPEPLPVTKSVPPPLASAPDISRTKTSPVPAASFDLTPARFFPRFVAFAIDVMVLFVPMVALFGLGALTISLQGMAERADAETMKQSWDLLLRNFRELLILVALGGAWLYASLLECSRWQATVGKQWVGIKVVDHQGERLTFFHATGRHAAKFISALPVFIGFAAALFSSGGLAWHDRIAHTHVVPKVRS